MSLSLKNKLLAFLAGYLTQKENIWCKIIDCYQLTHYEFIL